MLSNVNGNREKIFVAAGVLSVLLFLTVTGRSQTGSLRPVDYVNPLIGTAPMLDHDHLGNNPAPGEELYYGSVNPAAKVPDPDGTLELGPVSGFDGCCYHVRGSGYRYDDASIMGFTHFNGQYSRDNNLLFMPTTGVIRTEAGTLENPFLGYRSLKDTLREHASVGYYTVFLTTYGIKVELTATKNCGFHRYTFPVAQQANVLIDLANCRPAAKDASVHIIDRHSIEGYQWSGRNKIYFRAVFNKDFASYGTWKNGVLSPGSSSDSGIPLGAYLTFHTTAGEEVQVKVGTSRISQQDAANNLEQEIPGMDFDAVHRQAVSQWDEVLSHITVEGGTDFDRKNFYSCMYRLTEGPSYAGGWVGGSFCTPWTVRVFMRGWNWYNERVEKRDSNNLGSRWTWIGEFWGVGSAWAPVGMYNRGFRQFDLSAIYAKLREEAMSGGGAIGAAYRKYGYVPFGTANNCINHSLGLAYDDHVLAEYARILGKTGDYKYFTARSKNYKNVYNSSVGFFMPRNTDSTWFLVDPYDVHAESIYREGNAWNYLFYVMGDIPGLIDLLGGPKSFAARLDSFFTKPMPSTAFPLRDVTGFLGLYAHGNEPYRHIPYLYNYAGQPWKTQAIVREIQKTLHRPDPRGMCGMEDYGQLSGWYVSSAMGFYHVDNLTGDCDIGSPLFPKVTINIDGPVPGKFVIEAHNVSDQNMYIQSAMLNGKPLDVPKFHHSEIVPGGSLVFEMGPEPNYNWGTGRPADRQTSTKTPVKRPVDYVNPLIGTAPMPDKQYLGNNPAPGEELYYGCVNPGAMVTEPNGKICVGPVSGFDGQRYHVRGSGYRYTDTTIMGFTNLNGEYHDDNKLLFMPTVGAIRTIPGTRSDPFAGYRSAKDTLREKASPGYYTVFLTTYGIRVELTATSNCGFQRYTFPASRQANVLIDLANSQPWATNASVHILDKHTIEGFQDCGTDTVYHLVGSTRIYFHAVFSKDFDGSGIWKKDIVSPNAASDTGVPLGAYASFISSAGEQILVKIGTSRNSVQDAAANLARELPGMDFDGTHRAAEQGWSGVLAQATVEGGTEEEKINYYTSVYRKNGYFRGRVLWGNDNADPKPRPFRGRWGGGYWGTGSTGGVVGAYKKGQSTIDIQDAYTKLRNDAMTGGGAAGAAYRKYGYIPDSAGVNDYVNRTIGLSYEDYALSELAAIAGNTGDHDFFLARSKNYKKLFDPATGFFTPRRKDGSWILPLDPYNFHAEDIYREGNAWNYLWFNVGDIPGLIGLLGGREKFIIKLDSFFTTPLPADATPLRDCTGLIGLYCHGNEQYRNIPYYYNLVGQPWKTQAVVRKIQVELYRAIPAGLCGMDDYGNMTGWYASSALGYNSINEASEYYEIGSPLFPKTTIRVKTGPNAGGNPGVFTILAHNVSDVNMYIQSATLNGRQLYVPRFRQQDMIAGGSLVLEMGPAPNKNWGTGAAWHDTNLKDHSSH